MVRDNHNRRRVLKAIGASTVGISGIASATATSGPPGYGDPTKIEIDTGDRVDNAVPGDNVVDAGFSLGYCGCSDSPVDRWVDGSLEERWVHYFHASMTATCDSSQECYNINEQIFDAQFSGGAEHNGSPDAGAAAWPNPPLENWTGIVDAVVEGSLGTVSTIASIGLTADDVMNAYGESSFDTDDSDTIHFKEDYSAYTRETASHGVYFTVDQVPDTDGYVIINSEAGDEWGSNTVAGVDLDIYDEYVYVNANHDITSFYGC